MFPHGWLLFISELSSLLISFLFVKGTEDIGIYIDKHFPNWACYFQEVSIEGISLKKKKSGVDSNIGKIVY